MTSPQNTLLRAAQCVIDEQVKPTLLLRNTSEELFDFRIVPVVATRHDPDTAEPCNFPGGCHQATRKLRRTVYFCSARDVNSCPGFAKP